MSFFKLEFFSFSELWRIIPSVPNYISFTSQGPTSWVAWDISLGTGVSCFVTCHLQKVFELILVKEIFLTYYFNMITLNINGKIQKCSFQNPYFFYLSSPSSFHISENLKYYHYSL